ncbi:gonadotropin-releasing hormone II receptor-like [Poecilia reticulata]|nr:PREDICTED: gonadotropin-releasing hormone II receptor-like [Poecilia reticulata]
MDLQLQIRRQVSKVSNHNSASIRTAGTRPLSACRTQFRSHSALSPLLFRMSGNASSLTPPTGASPPPPLTDWEPPSFTRAARFRVGATSVLFLFAACSNLALLVSIWCGRGRRLSSHLRPLMLSLAAADLMMTFVVMPLDAAWNVTVQWFGGEALCKLLCFLKLFAMQAAAFILVVITLDRHYAILHPLDALSAHRRNRCLLLLAWSLSLLLASPQVSFW